MRQSPRNKETGNGLMIEEDFFKNLPSPKLRQEMRKVVCDHLDELEKKGINLTEIKDKNSLHCRVANLL